MLTLPASVRVFVARGATDLRRSFDRLSAQVQEVMRQDPLSGHVFVFFNRQRTYLCNIPESSKSDAWRTRAGTSRKRCRQQRSVRAGVGAHRAALLDRASGQ
jgi:transposase